MCGRLGNQLFQYAFARKIQIITGQELAIDFTAIENVNNPEWRNYLVDYNTHPYKIVTNRDYYPIQRYVYALLKRIRPKSNEMKQYRFDEFVSVLANSGIYYYESDFKCHDFKIKKSKNIIIRGWFESHKYFEDQWEIIKDEFTLKNGIENEYKDIERKLKNGNGICLSIRRGNFLDDAHRDKFFVCSPEYYYSSVKQAKKIHSDSFIYVCSDDIEWCKRELNLPGEVVYEPSANPTEKLYLMSLCKCFILSNSTFSWWAQYLSTFKNKTVIAPSRWRNKGLSPLDIYNDSWILIDSNGTIVIQN